MRNTIPAPRKLALATAVTAAIAASSAYADGRIEGRLTAAKGMALQGGQVRIDELNLTTHSQRDGRFVFPNLEPGRYTLVVDYLGANTERRELVVEDEKTTFADIKVSSSVPSIENVIVVGQAAAINKALNRQRTADNIVTAVSADAIGEFPDTNVSEALQRLPGVSIERDQGEGRYVRVRGLGPDFNAVTINGVSVPSPDSERRAVALDVIPSDLLESLIITKSLTPDMDANALGGSIEVQSLSAFDRDGLYYHLSAEGSYDDNRGDVSPKLALTGSNRFSVAGGEDNLGIALGISSFKRDFGSDNVETGGAWEFDDEPRLEEFEQRDYQITRKRSGLTLNLDYRLTDNTDLYWRNLYSEYTDSEIRLANVVEFEESLAPGETGSAEIARELKDREETQKILSTNVGGSTRLENWLFEYRAAYSKSSEDEPRHVAGGVFSGEFDDVGYTGTKKPLLIAPEDFYQPANYALDEIELAQTETSDTNTSLALDITRDLALAGNATQLKFGAKFKSREKDGDAETWILEDFEQNFVRYARGDVEYPHGQFGPGIDVSTVNELVSGIAVTGDERDAEESTIGDFDVTEDTSAAYVMGRIDLNKLRILTGLRYESTEFDAQGYRFEDEDSISRTHFSNKQDYWLPALHLRYSIGDDTQVRAAWTNSVVRPNFNQLSPGFYADGDEAEFGNPALEPLESSNIDLGIEHYTGVAGLLSAFVFYKDIDNFIYQTDVAGTAGFEDYDEAITYVNGDAAEVYGLELSASRQLTELPSPWNGILLGFNATVSESDAKIAYYDDDALVSRDLPMPSQSDSSANAMIGYESDKFSMRLSANYKSKYLLEVTDTTDAAYDVYVDAQTQLDFSMRYYLTDAVKVYFEALNITDEPYYTYVNEKRFNSQHETYGPTYKVGVSLTHF